MSEKKGAFEQVMAARFLAQTFEGLHGLQVDTLTVWGYLIFSHLKYGELEMAADMPSKVIQYDLKSDTAVPKKTKKRLPMLKENIQTLLGPEWDLVVIQNGKAIFGEQRDIATKINERRKQAAKSGREPADE